MPLFEFLYESKTIFFAVYGNKCLNVTNYEVYLVILSTCHMAKLMTFFFLIFARIVPHYLTTKVGGM